MPISLCLPTRLVKISKTDFVIKTKKKSQLFYKYEQTEKHGYTVKHLIPILNPAIVYFCMIF